MGYGQFSNRYHEPYNKGQLLATMREIEGRDICGNEKARLAAKNTLAYVMFHSPGIHSESWIYHETRILVVTYDNQIQCRPILSVMINTGGFNTITTRERLNRFLPPAWSVQTHNGVLFVKTPAGTFSNVDGAEYNGDGSPKNPALHKNEMAETLRIKKLIDAMAKKLARMESLPLPGGGDPWFVEWGNPEKIGKETLVDWLESCYINGSLLLGAMKRKGRNDYVLSLVYSEKPSSGRHSWRNQLRRDVRAFFKAGLGLA